MKKSLIKNPILRNGKEYWFVEGSWINYKDDLKKTTSALRKLKREYIIIEKDLSKQGLGIIYLLYVADPKISLSLLGFKVN